MMNTENKFNLRENANFPQKIVVKSTDIATIASDLMENLGAKQKLVLSSRFGISGRDPQTLESIGKSLNITRERVRQIEADSLNLLKKSNQSEQSKELFAIISETIEERGGIAKSETLTQEIFEKYFSRKAKDSKEKRLLEIVFSVAGLKKIKGNKEMEDGWSGKDFDIKNFRVSVNQIEYLFDESKKLFSEEELLKKIDITSQADPQSKIESEKIVNFLEVSKKFGKNVFGNWGKANWPLVRPRGVREKATLVLLNSKKPLHFREISQLIEKTGLSEKKVHPQTVHNELIRDKRFVLVGRGTYALREWGYEEGTVKDIIISIIKSAGGFLKKEVIVKDVLKKRKVKKATIAVNLSDKKFFEKTRGGYSLRNTK
jgi:hypothetical protein